MIHRGQTQAEIDAKKKVEALNAELAGLVSECERLSAKIVRPLVAMQYGSATEEDKIYFAEYNEKLKAARARMAEIKVELGI